MPLKNRPWKRVIMSKGLPPLFRRFAIRWCLAIFLTLVGLYVCVSQLNQYEMSLLIKRKTPVIEEPYKGPQIFVLQNLNFTDFGPSWKNEVLVPEQKSGKKKKKRKTPEELPVCAPLIKPLGKPVKICVHTPHELTTLQDDAKGDNGHLVRMSNFLEENPNSQVVDIGCNVGLFSMWAANMNIPVLAVDILPANLALLQLSAAMNDAERENYDLQSHSLSSYINKENKKKKPKKKRKTVPSDVPRKLSELITTLHNAVSNKRNKMQVEISLDDNKGHAHVRDLHPDIKKEKPGIKKVNKKKGKHDNEEEEDEEEDDDEEEEDQENEDESEKMDEDYEEDDEDPSEEILKMPIDSICLDDLLRFLDKDRKVFLKIDVEGAEDKVFHCAKRFFKKANVRIVFQELPVNKHSISRAKKVVKFLTHYGFAPFDNEKQLNLEDLLKWPTHVFWVKPGTTFKTTTPKPPSLGEIFGERRKGPFG